MENMAGNAVGAGGEVNRENDPNKTNANNEGGNKTSTTMVWMGYASTIVVAIADGLLIIFGYLAADKGKQLPPAIMIPAVGIITLLGVLAISNFFQGNQDLRNGQIRAAIAASVLAVYFFVLSLVMFTDASKKLTVLPVTQDTTAAANPDTGQPAGNSEAAATATPQKTGMADVMDSFTDLVKVVILGYFAVRGVNEVTNTVTDTIKQVNNNQTNTTPPAVDPNTTPLQKPDRSDLARPIT